MNIGRRDRPLIPRAQRQSPEEAREEERKAIEHRGLAATVDARNHRETLRYRKRVFILESPEVFRP